MEPKSFLEIASNNKKDSVDYQKFQCQANRLAFASHWHSNIEILFVEQGSMALTVGNKTVTVQKDDVCFVNTLQIHGASTVQSGVTYHMIQIKYELLCRLAKIDGRMKQFTDHEINVKSIFHDSNFGRFCNAAKSVTACRDNKSLSELGFACELFSCLFTRHQTDEQIALYSNRRFIEITEYIHLHHTEKLTIAALAKTFSFDTAYFSRKFKEVVGLTPSSYLCSLRVFSAQKMLLHTDHSIDFIAAECGFESTQYFIRCFKKQYGTSPLQYRKQNQPNA